MTRTLAMALCMLALTACSKPEKPETERRPEPQAANSQAANTPDPATWDDASKREKPDTRLLDRIQAPMDKARATEQTVLDQGAQQRADIDAQTAGNANPPPAR